jgi:hypothetical protein
MHRVGRSKFCCSCMLGDTRPLLAPMPIWSTPESISQPSGAWFFNIHLPTLLGVIYVLEISLSARLHLKNQNNFLSVSHTK